MGQSCVIRVRSGESTLVTEVANWVFVHPETGAVYNVDAVAGRWECTPEGESAPTLSGDLDPEFAAAICRAAYESQHQDEPLN